MSMPSGTELLLIFGIIILMFGAKKIPDLAKGLGQGIKSFKEMKKEADDVEEAEIKTAQNDTPAKKVEPLELSRSTTPKTSQQA